MTCSTSSHGEELEVPGVCTFVGGASCIGIPLGSPSSPSLTQYPFKALLIFGWQLQISRRLRPILSLVTPAVCVWLTVKLRSDLPTSEDALITALFRATVVREVRLLLPGNIHCASFALRFGLMDTTQRAQTDWAVVADMRKIEAA